MRVLLPQQGNFGLIFIRACKFDPDYIADAIIADNALLFGAAHTIGKVKRGVGSEPRHDAIQPVLNYQSIGCGQISLYPLGHSDHGLPARVLRGTGGCEPHLLNKSGRTNKTSEQNARGKGGRAGQGPKNQNCGGADGPGNGCFRGWPGTSVKNQQDSEEDNTSGSGAEYLTPTRGSL